MRAIYWKRRVLITKLKAFPLHSTLGLAGRAKLHATEWREKKEKSLQAMVKPDYDKKTPHTCPVLWHNEIHGTSQ